MATRHILLYHLRRSEYTVAIFDGSLGTLQFFGVITLSDIDFLSIGYWLVVGCQFQDDDIVPAIFDHLETLLDLPFHRFVNGCLVYGREQFTLQP